MAERINNMNDKYDLDYIESVRKKLHDTVDYNVDRLIERLKNNEPKELFEDNRTLNMYSYLKGKKPIAVKLPSGEIMPARTWKNVAEIVLKDCNSNQECHNRLLELCDKVAGRNRMILGSTTADMVRPIEIDKGIYFESYFDTEYLLKMMCERVLKFANYDYSKIRVDVFDPKLVEDNSLFANIQTDISDTEDESQSDDEGFNLSM